MCGFARAVALLHILWRVIIPGPRLLSLGHALQIAPPNLYNGVFKVSWVQAKPPAQLLIPSSKTFGQAKIPSYVPHPVLTLSCPVRFSSDHRLYVVSP